MFRGVIGKTCPCGNEFRQVRINGGGPPTEIIPAGQGRWSRLWARALLLRLYRD